MIDILLSFVSLLFCIVRDYLMTLFSKHSKSINGIIGLCYFLSPENKYHSGFVACTSPHICTNWLQLLDFHPLAL